MKLLNLARRAAFLAFICFLAAATSSAVYGQSAATELGSLDKVAKFKGGDKALNAFLAKEIKYPEGCKQVKAQGTIMVGFTVEADGSLSNVRHTGHPETDNRLVAEALRVVSLMPKWEPAQKSKQAVASNVEIPVKFAL